MTTLCEGRGAALTPRYDLAGDRTKRLLLTCAGRRVGLMHCFQHEAQNLGIGLKIIACDLDPRLSPACRLADTMLQLPPVTDPSYVDEVIRICVMHDVTLVVPTIDPELLPLSQARERFTAIGADLVISSPALVRLARDKLETARFLAAHDIPAPKTDELRAARDAPHEWQWPLMVKPRHGSASRGISVATNPQELPTEVNEPMVVQEFLTGTEYTVNIFFDSQGQFRAAVPHQRLRVRAGEVEKGTTCRHAALHDIAEKLAAALPGPRGALCFQAIVSDSQDVSVFEINARFGGGYPLADAAGARFTKWILEEHAGLPSTASNESWRDNLTMLRYDAALFVAP